MPASRDWQLSISANEGHVARVPLSPRSSLGQCIRSRPLNWLHPFQYRPVSFSSGVVRQRGKKKELTTLLFWRQLEGLQSDGEEKGVHCLPLGPGMDSAPVPPLPFRPGETIISLFVWEGCFHTWGWNNTLPSRWTGVPGTRASLPSCIARS